MSKRDCKASWTGKLEHPETHILTLKILDMIGSGAGPCGIPENTGIPGLNSNTDTGIFENKIPVFFGILV